MTTEVQVRVASHQVKVVHVQNGTANVDLLTEQNQVKTYFISGDQDAVTVAETADLSTTPASGMKPEGAVRDISAEEAGSLTQKY